MSLLDTIKSVVKNYCDNIKMTDVVYGTLTSVSPPSLKVDSYVETLSNSFVVIPKHLLKHDIKLTREGQTYDYTMESQLKSGDRVVCIKKLGGQLYVVVGKVE